MHYYGIPGPCAIPVNNMTPSEQDFNGLRDAYPMTVPEEASEESRTAAAPDVLAIEGLPEEVRELVEMSTSEQ
jgi:hypothetical protein